MKILKIKITVIEKPGSFGHRITARIYHC